MSNLALNPAVRLENARALASAIGLDDIERAAQLLDISVLVTASPDDCAAHALANDIKTLLSRTVTCVALTPPHSPCSIEITIGAVEPKSRSPRLQVNVDQQTCQIGHSYVEGGYFVGIHPLYRKLVACYAAAVALKFALGDRLPLTVPNPLILDFSSLGIDPSSLDQKIDLGNAYMAGAGAIGNGSLWAFQDLHLHGQLHIVDFDKVEDKNLQRQIWFDEHDVGELKSKRLVMKAQQSFTHLKLIPRVGRLQDLEERCSGPWLRKLIVAVDSRRGRRLLQDEAPCEVFDASTTDIREVVLHYHRQPTDDACLACIYREDAAERDFESHIAEKLGVPLAKVRELLIDIDAATIIASRYASSIREPSQIIGIPYETLFKSLCSEGSLVADHAHPPVVAPFAFVSALAGVMLAFEIVRRHTYGNHENAFNYWRISPWHPPHDRLRRLVPAITNCSFCANELVRETVRALWAK